MARHLFLYAALLVRLCHGSSDRVVLEPATTTCTGKTAVPSGYSDEQTPDNSLTVQGITRRFGVYVPDTYDPTQGSKVIFDFHGAHGTPTGQYDNSMYYLNANGKDYLVIYPLGLYNNTWQGAPGNSANDTAFVEALLPFIKEKYCIDPSSIFASGKSQGGGFVDQLACSSLGDNFAAFAMASPALYQHWRRSLCNDTKPRKVLESHGAIDVIIPYDGCLVAEGCQRKNDGQLPPIGNWTWWWAKADKYSPRQYIDPDKPHFDTVSYTGNANGGIVKHFYIHNLGHCWPQGFGYPPNTDYTKSENSRPGHNRLKCFSHAIDFTQEVVSFFEAAVSAQRQDTQFSDEL